MLFFNGTVHAEHNPLENYDNFNARKFRGCKGCINTQKWEGSEILREVKGKKLHLKHRSWGGTDSDTETEQVRNRVKFTDSELFSGVCFTPRIKKYEINNCAANDEPGQVRIRYLGSFYDTDDNDDADDGVVYAGIELIRDGNSDDNVSKFSIEAWASQCAGEDCKDPEPWSTYDDINDPDLNFGTTKASKNKKALCIGYDSANHELVFSYGNDVRTVNADEHGLPAINSILTSGETWHVIEAITDVPNCTTGQLTAAVDGDVDNVKVSNLHLYEIGGTGPAGGIVFYVTAGGLHGLEAAPTDQGTTRWGCGPSLFGVPLGVAIGLGAQNTVTIVAGLVGCAVPNPAAQIADEYSLNGYDDWFLPSADETAPLWDSRIALGLCIDNDLYWSSSKDTFENSPDSRVCGTGGIGNSGQVSLRGVRPVRSF